MNRMITAGALALTAAGLLASAVPAAQAAGPNTCIYNTTSKNVSIKLVSGGFVELEREGDKLVTFDAFGKTVCASTSGVVATRFNTGAIFMNGSLATPNEDFIVSYANGFFTPGAPGGADPDKAEITVFNGNDDIVDLAGSPSSDMFTVV